MGRSKLLMIIIASYKNKAEPLVESIKKYTPHEKFVVVDSDVAHFLKRVRQQEGNTLMR